MNAYEVLSQLAYFSALPESELEALCLASNVMTVEKGQEVIAQGTRPDGLLVVVEGTFEVVRRSGNEDVRLGEASVGEVLGEMSILEDLPASATVRALEPGTIVKVPVDQFRHVMSDPVLLGAMFRTVTERLRAREAALVQSEKMASLGALAAGLLHEVNNPAAAIVRAADHLASLTKNLVPVPAPIRLSALERVRLERDLSAVLTEVGAEKPADVAASLVAQNWNKERLLESATSPEEQVRLAYLVHARQLASEVMLGAGRISDLVGAVKRFAYTGQGPVQDVDLNQIVADSSRLLKHKTAGKHLEIEPAETLPTIPGHGVELSQVVTNLLDNALDVANAKIAVRTSSNDDEVVVEFEDDGPGIAPELVARIWEPFFTTKAPGQGTGLGLAITRRIVVAHGGRIDIDSRPGSTVFRVRLPRRTAVTSGLDQ